MGAGAAEVISCAGRGPGPGRRSAFKPRAGRRERGGALNGARGGAARLARLASPLCGQPAGTPPGPSLAPPRPPRPLLPRNGDPAAAVDENDARSTADARGGRPGAGCATGIPASSREVSGTVRPAGRAGLGVCARPEGVWLGGEDRLPAAGGRLWSRCLSTWNRAPSRRERREPRGSGWGTRTRRRGDDFRGEPGLGTGWIQLLPGGAHGAHLQALRSVACALARFQPSLCPPHLISAFSLL